MLVMMTLYNTIEYAFPIAIYGSESWTMQKADEQRVDAFEMWCYRRVLRIPWTARKTNAWVLYKIGNSLMLREMVRMRKLRFFVIRCNSMEGTRKNDHHREGQWKEKERPSSNIMAQGHQENSTGIDTARCCASR